MSKARLKAKAAAKLEAATQSDHPVDPVLIWTVLSIVLIGFVMVFSASIGIAEGSRFTGYDPYFFIKRHGIFLIIGVIAGAAAFSREVSWWQQWAPIIFLAVMVLLVLVLIPGIGKSVNGSRRWIQVGPINIQPSELMKVAVALYAADFTARKLDFMNNLTKGFFPIAFAIVAVIALLLLEPDMGALVVITMIAFGILFMGGIKMTIFIVLMVVAIAGFVAMMLLSPYRLARVVGFMDPFQDPFGKGYQLSHALIAFGRGEWLGVGLGASIEKLFYLPEAHTDFLLSVIAEELGFVGICVIVALFTLLVLRCFRIGRDAIRLDRHFAGLFAQGAGLWFGVQSFINMGVNMGLLPTKGLTLPLMSFGGSGIVANMIALGIVARIDWENRVLGKRQSIVDRLKGRAA